jgi:formylglycine-generating enzyme required for sulfatase activity
LGLYDMSGNVLEWCGDRYGDYGSSSQTDPAGPSSGSSRVARVGGWHAYAQYERIPKRYDATPDVRYYGLGFRLASGSK